MIHRAPRFGARALSIAATLLVSASSSAQVHYHEGGQPWKQRASSGPDAEVPGWFYNLGITGMRAALVADAPKSLVIRHVFANTPASGLVRIGDHIIGAAGQPFRDAHRNGYGEEVFGATGPVQEFAAALEAAQSPTGQEPGKLSLILLRDGTQLTVVLDVGTAYGSFAKEFRANCPKSEKVAAEPLEYLVKSQRAYGTFYYQPNRDNACYGSDARMTASSVTAFMLLLPKRSLVLTGKVVSDARPAAPEVAPREP